MESIGIASSQIQILLQLRLPNIFGNGSEVIVDKVSNIWKNDNELYRRRFGAESDGGMKFGKRENPEKPLNNTGVDHQYS